MNIIKADGTVITIPPSGTVARLANVRESQEFMEINEIQKLRAALELAQRKLSDTRENLAYEARMHVLRDTPIGALGNAVVEHDRIASLVHNLGEKLASAEDEWLEECLKS